jgi:aspartyl-tRNA(Asn)/glutamyl-tRNA(Gln) amidotransferase subunit A
MRQLTRLTGQASPGWSLSLSAAQAARAIGDHVVSASEYVSDVLASVSTNDTDHRAFVETYAESALRDAEVSDERLARGAGRPLEGVVFAVKDLIDVQGRRTRGASDSTSSDPVPCSDAEVVSRLRANGAILVGKLALEELGIGPTVENAYTAPPVNPWNPQRSTGGSSSGCAVAVAAGLVPFAIGTDTAGSIRLPAAHCGVMGYKPSYGAIGHRGVLALSPTLDHIGIVTRNAGDAELVLRAAAADPRIDEPGSLSAARIGVVDFASDCPGLVDAEIAVAVEEAVAAMRACGAEVEQATMAPLQTYQSCGAAILHAEAFKQHKTRLRRSGHLMQPSTYRRLASGSAIRGRDYAVARALRETLIRDFDRTMEDFDALVTITTLRPPGPAFDVDTSDDTSSTLSPRIPFNVVGAPVIAVPIGLTTDGMPLSMQLVGARGADHRLLPIAHAYEQVFGDGRVQWRMARRA